MTNSIATIETMTANDIFGSYEIDNILKIINKEVMLEVPDMSTAQGRKNIISRAAKVSKLKVHLDNLGKGLVSKLKGRTSIIDQARKKMRDNLNVLRDDVRRPVTDWEDVEKDRVLKIKNRIKELEGLAVVYDPDGNPYSSEFLMNALRVVEEEVIDSFYAEFTESAQNIKDIAISILKTHIKSRALEEYEIEAKEERENEIRMAEEARIEAALLDKRIADDKCLEAEQALKIAEAKAYRSEQLLKEQQIQAAREKRQQLEEIEHQEQLLKEQQIQVAREKRREVEEKEQQERALQEREADQEHRNNINREVYSAFKEGGLEHIHAKLAAELIIKKLIPNVTINY